MRRVVVADGFSVETTALTAAASQLDGTAAQVAAAAGPVPPAAEAAAGINPGFLTSQALVQVAGRLATSLQQLSRELTGHGQGLRANAKAYEDTEQENARLFDADV
jgi:hypothetical protein